MKNKPTHILVMHPDTWKELVEDFLPASEKIVSLPISDGAGGMIEGNRTLANKVFVSDMPEHYEGLSHLIVPGLPSVPKRDVIIDSLFADTDKQKANHYITVNLDSWKEAVGEFFDLSERTHIYTVFRANGQSVASYLTFGEADRAIKALAGEIHLNEKPADNVWVGYSVDGTRYAIVQTPLLSGKNE